MIVKYIEQKCEAYKTMNNARKQGSGCASLSEIYSFLPAVQRYAVALDTFDCMYLESSSFAVWCNSDYARVTLQELENLLGAVIASIDDIRQIRIIYLVSRAIDLSIAVLKEINPEEGDILAIEQLQPLNSIYRSLRSEFMEIMTQWFESQA